MKPDDLVRLGHMIEAAVRVSPEARSLAPDVPWQAIVGMRNRLVHAYFNIDRDTLWQAAIAEIPALLPLLLSLVSRG